MTDLNLHAYYYSFSPTGAIAVDKVLEAVATAGRRYHHTEHWLDEDDGPSECDRIQAAAMAAAAEIERLMNALELAWALIANARSWDEAHQDEWRAAMERWRDQHWHPALDRNVPSG
jgi:hypothetical protein